MLVVRLQKWGARVRRTFSRAECCSSGTLPNLEIQFWSKDQDVKAIPKGLKSKVSRHRILRFLY